MLVVGSYTHSYGPFRAQGNGIALVGLSTDDGQLATLDELEGLANPAYLRVAGQGGKPLIYASLEAEGPSAGIALLTVTPERRLRLVQKTSVTGDLPCHLDLAPGERWLAGCCYGSGHVFVKRLDGRHRDGLLSERDADCLLRTGSSVHPIRQTASHPHATRFSPDGRWLLVPDLGTDEVACYSFDSDTGCLGRQRRLWRSPQASGPRLLQFDANGRYVVLVQELASTITSFRWQGGRLDPVSTISSHMTPYRGNNTAAGLRRHPAGRLFAVSNRGANTITLLDLDPDTGMITAVWEQPTGGDKPRDFDFSPCGRWLVAANQDSDCLVVLAVEGRHLADTGIRLSVASPSCVRFV